MEDGISVETDRSGQWAEHFIAEKLLECAERDGRMALRASAGVSFLVEAHFRGRANVEKLTLQRSALSFLCGRLHSELFFPFFSSSSWQPPKAQRCPRPAKPITFTQSFFRVKEI